jgi:hypothetical protein
MSPYKLLPEGVAPTASCRLYTDTTDPFGWGLRPEQDYLLTGPLPEDPVAFEAMNVWFFDGERNIGFNIHATMQHGEMRAPVTIFLPDGRILRIRTDEPAKFTDPKRPHSTHVAYECIKPFRNWTFSIEYLPVWVTSKVELDAGVVADKSPSTSVTLKAKAVMVAPVYMQGTMLREAADAVKGEAGLWLAARLPLGMTPESFRFDQMFRAVGEVAFEGRTYQFNGYGLRGHVRGVRIMQGMYAHTWMAGAFPSGAAFGIQTFPRPEGGYFFTEAYIYKNGVMYPNRVIYAPLMSYDPDQGDYVIELACDQLGLSRIVGRDKRLFWWSMPAWGTAQPPRWGIDPAATTVMRQATAKYLLDDEIGYGMNERSGPRP